ncbi:helix-turn-helix transcriptional regulator [Streptomyces sp. NPDC007088]|uniref:helix-turn-helix transcriptional regulator n=1 Tax=Streptomyces sp. NPDC007088 TaxID=3364773 RepID=UPI0036C81A67
MATKDTHPTHSHSVAELCEEGRRIYSAALRAGRIARKEADAAPCLMDYALLRPDPDNTEWLRPVPPSLALAQRLQPIEQEIQQHRLTAVALADSFEPFMAISVQDPATTHAITVLEGLPRIQAAIELAMSESRTEILTIQPGGGRGEDVLTKALELGRQVASRGITMRTLYQHTVRHNQGTYAYAERMGKHTVEIRTLEELTERLMIFDRSVAFIPAQDDRSVALELRHPGIVDYLARVFEQFWARAVPLLESPPYAPPTDGITGIQLSIARLLIEGHVDEAIARRLGMNVRTCRAHIAKLAAALGSGSRAQLGYLVAKSGILEETGKPEAAPGPGAAPR